MNEYVAKITLDLNCQATPIVISAGQYDIGRRIKINLTADGEAYDATGATAVCKGKSGSNYFAVNATVAKNIVTVTTDKAMLSSAGRTVAKIVLTDGTRTYSTQPFVINTHGDYDGDITSSDYYPELLDILSRVIALTESGAVLTDTALDAKSVNPVQNKVLTAIINSKSNKATTLAGYGITDAYTREKTNEKLARKLDSMPFDDEPKQNSPCYITSGAAYNSLLTKADVNSVYSKTEADVKLGKKADKAEVDDVKAFVGYTDNDIIGVCVDYENKTFTRLAGAVNLSQGADFDRFAMFGGRRRCNVSDDGTILAYYGDKDYTEDGSNGQVMVYQPQFFYKVIPLKLEKNTDSEIGFHLRKACYYVSSKPKTGFKLHPAFRDENGNAINYILFSADEGSMYDVSAKAYVNDNVDENITYEDGDLLCSVAGKKPISGLKKGIGTKSNLELMAQNRGAGWHLETIKATSANQLLMMIEFGMMSSQTGVGQGVVSITDNTSYNCSSLTGSTADLGNGTGSATETINEIGGTETAYTTAGKLAVSYRGYENPWGNIWRHIQGVNIWGDGTMCGGQPYVANDFAFNNSKHSENYEPVGFTLPNATGYINAMGYGSEEYDWLLMPSEIGGTNALPVGDFLYETTNLKGYRTVQLGGSWSNGSYAGSFSWYCDAGVGYSMRKYGGRLVYIPTAKSGDKPTKSYSASEVDSLLATKYDSANIESGTSKLTPYSTVADKIKSASCTYKTIGDVVIVSATVKMNAVSLAGNSMCPLIDLPYKCISEDNVFCVGISNLGKLFKFAIPKNNTWLQFSTQDKTAYTFADGEQINVICLYKIK